MSQSQAVAPSPPAPSDGARSRPGVTERSLRVALRIVSIGPVFLLAVLVLTFWLLKPVFLSEGNVQNIITQTSVIALLAIGQLLVIVTRGIDVSVGSIVGLSTVIGATVYGTSANNGAVVVAAMLGIGVVVGLINGVVYVYGRLPNSIINTLGMLYIAQGAALVITRGDTLVGVPPAVTSVGTGFVGTVPVAAFVLAGVAAVAWVCSSRTVWGRWVYAVGGNKEAAERVGIPVRKVQVSVFVVSGLMAGIAGIIVAGQTDSGYGTAGAGTELSSIAAVIIGGASFLGGRGSVGDALVGAFIIGALRNGLDLLGIYPTWQLVAVGSVMLVAVLLDQLRIHLEERFRVAHAARERAR